MDSPNTITFYIVNFKLQLFIRTNITIQSYFSEGKPTLKDFSEKNVKNVGHSATKFETECCAYQMTSGRPQSV